MVPFGHLFGLSQQVLHLLAVVIITSNEVTHWKRGRRVEGMRREGGGRWLTGIVVCLLEGVGMYICAIGRGEGVAKVDDGCD